MVCEWNISRLLAYGFNFYKPNSCLNTHRFRPFVLLKNEEGPILKCVGKFIKLDEIQINIQSSFQHQL